MKGFTNYLNTIFIIHFIWKMGIKVGRQLSQRETEGGGEGGEQMGNLFIYKKDHSLTKRDVSYTSPKGGGVTECSGA